MHCCLLLPWEGNRLPCIFRGECMSECVQVTNPVQWERTLKTLLEKGLQQSYEIGPNKVIAGIMKRIDKTSPITNITA
jgi:hypothetical protein